jgi:hypothetical protein
VPRYADLACPEGEREERAIAMNFDGLLDATMWMGGGAWLWTSIAVLLVVVLLVTIGMLSSRRPQG